MTPAVLTGPVSSGTDPVVWTVLALLMGLGAVSAALCSWRRARALRRRVRSLAGVPRSSAPTLRSILAPRTRRRREGRAAAPGRRRAVRETAAATGGFACGVLLVDGAACWPAGVAAGLAGWFWQRRRARRAVEHEAAAGARTVDRQLPLVAELLAACLAAGSEPARAADAVGRSTGGPLGDQLVRAAAELRLGGEPAAVWGGFATLGGCEELARCMERAGSAGVPPVVAVARLAAECRARRTRAAVVRARRAAVQVTGPLGLCFLPAFLAVGVAPVVLGMARSLL
jgi:Flp pilus assembly protein TadB